MQLKVDTTEQWEDLISTVVQDQVPIGCVKKVMFKLKGGKQKTINLQTLRKQGLDAEEIETVITRKMLDLQNDIANMDFVIDVNRVAEYVQPLTDKILEKL
jgi:hypothetical protein